MSANYQPGCLPPIHLSSLPWLVVTLPLVAPHPPPLCRLYNAPPHSLVLFLHNLHLSLFQGASGFQDSTVSGLLVPPADCHAASCCAAAASRPLNDPPPPVCKRLPSHWPLVCQLVVVSLMLLHCRGLLFFWHAASASCPRDTQTYHLVALPPQVSILDPPLHSHWLVVASHLFVLLPPTILSSTPPPLDALATHLPSRLPLVCPNLLPVCLTWYAR